MRADPKPVFRALLILCAAYVVGSLVWFVWLCPADVEYPHLPFQLEPQVIHPGDVVRFHPMRINHSSSVVKTRITRWLLNVETGEETDLFAIKRDLPPNEGLVGHDTDIAISKATAPGRYRICGETKVPGSFPFPDRDIPWCTTDFEVVP